MASLRDYLMAAIDRKKAGMILAQAFFNRPTLMVAQELLGKYLVARRNGRPMARMITEVEAYDGPFDRASHAHRGLTARNAPMFGPGGCWYVYLCYGVHWMLNMVTGREGYPAAILVRGIEGAVGPGKVTRLLGITKAYNARPADRGAGLWIEDRGVSVDRKQVHRSARIGVAYAGVWAKKLYRFHMKEKLL